MSLASIWQTIHLHYGFQATGAHLFDLADFKIQSDERHEDLYQRLMAFFEDNLLLKDGLNHQGIPLDEHETSPSLINIVVLHWLQPVYPSLPRMVKQRYGTELRSCTLASIKALSHLDVLASVCRRMKIVLKCQHTSNMLWVSFVYVKSTLNHAGIRRSTPSSSTNFKHAQKFSDVLGV